MQERRGDRDGGDRGDRNRRDDRSGGVLRPLGGLNDFEEPRMAPVAQVPPPANADVAHVIEEMAKHVLQYGVVFEEKVRDLQKSNPRFEFLKGGAGSDYFDWVKFDLREQERLKTANSAPWQRNAPSSMSSTPSGPPVDRNAVALSPGELSHLDGLLQRLQPTQESIKESKDWIMERAHLANDVVDFFLAKIQEFKAFAPRLHLLYLVNDILLHSSRASQDHYGPAFQRALSNLCTAAADDQVASSEQREQVVGLVNIWKDKQFYPVAFLDELVSSLNASMGQKRAKKDPWAY
jgi:hypothetical protein